MKMLEDESSVWRYVIEPIGFPIKQGHKKAFDWEVCGCNRVKPVQRSFSLAIKD